MSVVTDTSVRSEENFRVTRSRRNVAWTGAGALIVVVVLALFPYIVYSGTTSLMVQGFIVLTLASMWNLLAGYAGLVSVGQQAFVGLGAYFVLILAQHGLSPFGGLPVAAIGCGVAAVPMWWLVSRLRSGYFAIATWVLATAIMLFIERFPSIGGGTGMSLPGLSGYDPTLLVAYTYWIGLAVTVLALVTVYFLLRGRLGLVLTAIRDDEVAARSSGARVGLARMLVFVVAAVGCGAAGAVLAISQLIVQPGAVFSVQWTANDGVRGDHRRARHDRGSDPRRHRVHDPAADAAVLQRLVPDRARAGGDRRRAVRAARAVGPDGRSPAHPAVPGRILAMDAGEQRGRTGNARSGHAAAARS